MSKSFNLFSSKIFIFFLVFIFSLFIITIYHLFKNDSQVPYNFQPYPKFSPKSIPDIDLGDDNCYNKLTKCSGDGTCPNCEENYECVNVEREGQYVINNTSVPIGKYCLPKVGDLKCNKYTGSWTWINDPEYCGEKGNQCWKCICKYPTLFDGDDCSKQKACTTPQAPTQYLFTNLSKGINLKNSENIKNKDLKVQSIPKLISTIELEQDTCSDPNSAQCIKTGTEWNPTSGDDNLVLQVNPYGKNKDGKAYFHCDCNTTDTNSSKLIRLPRDPYRCHNCLCDQENHTKSGTYNETTQMIDCVCKSEEGGAMYKIDPTWNVLFPGTCVNPTDICREISSSDEAVLKDGNIIADCNCHNGFSQKCISNLANIDKKPCIDKWTPDIKQKDGIPLCTDNVVLSSTDYLPYCQNDNNKIGVECRDPCFGIDCDITGGHYERSSDNKKCDCVCNSGYKKIDDKGDCVKCYTSADTENEPTNIINPGYNWTVNKTCMTKSFCTTCWLDEDRAKFCCNGTKKMSSGICNSYYVCA